LSDDIMFSQQFLLTLLAAGTLAVSAQAPIQTSAKPEVVPPPISTVRPLALGPALDPAGPRQLSPLPVDYGVEHPLLICITIFKEEPLERNQVHGDDPSSLRYYNSITRVSTDGTQGRSAWWGYSGIDQNGSGPIDATAIPADTFAKIKRLVASLPDDCGCVPPRNHKVAVSLDGAQVRMYDAANLPKALLEILRLTDSDFTPIPK
jgi:hypothetical protein